MKWINFTLIIMVIGVFTSCIEPKEPKSNLPKMEITTENGEPIVSKEVYLNGNIELFDTSGDEDELLLSAGTEIRGRGNSTWQMPKKPYRVKFTEKQSLFNFPESKHWGLLANYMDKTMLRNEVAFELGRMSILDWTPRSEFVDVFLNGELQGTYQLTELIRADEHRVNIPKNGFLIEVDHPGKVDDDDITFTTERLKVLFTIKEPDVVVGDENYNWIKDHITYVEKVLYGDDFLDPETGYKAYIDIESFVDWYLINEIAKNPDAVFTSSCYMNIIPGEKLKMGPIWDFDIGFGCGYFDYYDATPNDFWVQKSYWINRMFYDPEFVDLVKVRFDYFKSNKNKIINSMLNKASYIETSAVFDDQIWQRLEAGDDYDKVLERYKEEVKYLENWIKDRFDWLENAYNEL